MTTEQVKKLKIAVNQFYLGKYLDQPTLSDEEYDSLEKEYTNMNPEGDVKDLVDWELNLVQDNEAEEPLEKEIIHGSLSQVLDRFDSHNAYINLKYDGGGIKCIYDTKGRLQRIQSTPDEKTGIIRTEQFWGLVPHQLNPRYGIKCLRGEVLVDADVYGKLARNKANGLINSTINQDEIENEAFIRIYKIQYHDNDWSYRRQSSDLNYLPSIMKVRTRLTATGEYGEFEDYVFASASRIDPDYLPKDAIYHGDPYDQDTAFQCDGIVIYDKDGAHGFKFYYTDSAVTTIKDILWNKQSNGSYAAVLALDPITLDDKYIQKASSNGVPKMIHDGCGIGAKVKVILANTTIPKVIEVLEPSNNFNFPKCNCGYQMSEEDIYGSTLKCGNTKPCIEKMDKWMPEFLQWILEEDQFKDILDNDGTIMDLIKAVPKWFMYIYHIDRWDPYDKCIEEMPAEVAIKIFACDTLYEDIKDELRKYFNFSDLQLSNLEINFASGNEIIRNIHKYTRSDIREYFDIMTKKWLNS